MATVLLKLGKDDRPYSLILTFQKENRWLSNFWPCSVTLPGENIDGVDMPSMEFKSVENAYQAWKSNSLEQRKNIQLKTAGESKDFSNDGHISLRSDILDELKIQAMGILLVQKFSDKNIELKQKLIETGHSTLMESNDWGDDFWGVCLKTGQGQNKLGQLIMNIRNELIK